MRRSGPIVPRGYPPVIDTDAPALTILEECFDDLSLVVHRKGDVVIASLHELPNDHLENGVVPNGHQRLGQYNRIRAQTSALTSGQDDSAPRH